MALAHAIAEHLPYLRRYARALSGTQSSGDAYVRACLEAIVADSSILGADLPPRVGLYRLFHRIWGSTDSETRSLAGSAASNTVERRLVELTPAHRQALLLTAMEGFTPEDTGFLIGASPQEVETLVSEALAEIERQTRARVLIIEDEPATALDLEEIVERGGHAVVGIASTHAEALDLARSETPALILADIRLADDSSGVEAVNDINAARAVPAVYVTAFPDQAMAEAGPGSLVVAKPFSRQDLAGVIDEALALGPRAG